MSNLTGEARARYVRGMFARIARRYDLMNRMMTGGQDMRWRRMLLDRLHIPTGAWVLDLGAGTGDLARQLLRRDPRARAVAADFTLEMMRVGQQRAGSAGVNWCAADALALPFVEESFDAVVSGFLMRNVADLPRALREQWRVLKPGGRIGILDTTQPPENLLAPLIRFHLDRVIPALGSWITGDSEAYAYLPASTHGFLRAEALAARMVEAGFRQVGFRRMMLGTVAIHWGVK